MHDRKEQKGISVHWWLLWESLLPCQPLVWRVESRSVKQPWGGAPSLGQTFQTVMAPCGWVFMSCKGLFLILEISFHLSLPLVKIEKLTALGSEAIQLVQKHPNVSVVSIVTEYQKPSEKHSRFREKHVFRKEKLLGYSAPRTERWY